MFSNHTSCMLDEIKFPNCLRKRVREVNRQIQPEFNNTSAADALDLINRFNELSLFEENEERICDKDTDICQDFIERFEKLYKPVKIGEDKAVEKWPIEPYNGDKCLVTLKLQYSNVDDKDDCPMHIFKNRFAERLAGRNLKNKYKIWTYLQEDSFKNSFNDWRPPYGWFEDLIMGKVVIQTELFGIGTRHKTILIHGFDNFNSDLHDTIGRTSKKYSTKTLMYVQVHSNDDSDCSSVAKRRKLK